MAGRARTPGNGISAVKTRVTLCVTLTGSSSRITKPVFSDIYGAGRDFRIEMLHNSKNLGLQTSNVPDKNRFDAESDFQSKLRPTGISVARWTPGNVSIFYAFTGRTRKTRTVIRGAIG